MCLILISNVIIEHYGINDHFNMMAIENYYYVTGKLIFDSYHHRLVVCAIMYWILISNVTIEHHGVNDDFNMMAIKNY